MNLADIRICIDVDDLERAIRFYTGALVLRVGRRFGDDWVELLGAPVPIDLLLKPAGSPASAGTPQVRDYGRHWTPLHLDLVVPALDVAVARARELGARLEGTIQERTWGRMATLADPFGHGLCLLEFRGRGYDEIAGG